MKGGEHHNNNGGKIEMKRLSNRDKYRITQVKKEKGRSGSVTKWVVGFLRARQNKRETRTGGTRSN